MEIENRINDDIKKAMLAKDARRLEALRAIKSALLLLKTSAEGLSESTANKALQREVKKRKETAEIYKQQNRPDLEETELEQARVIEEYLPKQMNETELREAVREIVKQTGASGPADLGKVMGAASKALAGKADNKMIAGLVKEMLS